MIKIKNCSILVTHKGINYAGAYAFDVYVYYALKSDITMDSEICQKFCENLGRFEDPDSTNLSLRGNFIVPNDNYYTQFFYSSRRL